VKDKGYNDPAVTVVNGNIEIADAFQCQTMCANSPDCKVFTYYITSGGCWLQGIYGDVPPLESIPGVLSGPKVCPPVHSAEEGADGDSGADLGASPEDASAEKASVVTDAGDGSGAGQSNAGKADVGAIEPRKDASGGGFPVWAGVMIAFLAIIGAVVGFYVFRGDDNKKGVTKGKKRTRGGTDLSMDSSQMSLVSTTEVADVSQPASPMYSVMSTASFASSAVRPVPTVTSVVPTYAVAPPVVTAVVEAPPTTVVAPPVVTAIVEAPPQIVSRVVAAPLVPSHSYAVAAPTELIQQQSASPPQDLFDRLDTNHDGVLTRAEFRAGAAP